MELQFVTVSETGASELLPLHSETVRVFLIVRESRADGRPGSLHAKPSPLPTLGPTVRRSSGRAHPRIA
ncbi:MAG TPA: hypothetical protein VEY12_03235 [Thermoplasmata archaeon]|nr:hypothetical protein [Thermoplasmata archaeon]